MERCRVIDAHGDKGRLEAEGFKRAHRQADIPALGLQSGDDRHSAGKTTQYTAKSVRVDTHGVPAGRSAGSKRRITKRARRISLGGTKSPVTPTRRSAISGCWASARATRSSTKGDATAAAMMRSTIHLPRNSSRRQRSYAASAESISR